MIYNFPPIGAAFPHVLQFHWGKFSAIRSAGHPSSCKGSPWNFSANSHADLDVLGHTTTRTAKHIMKVRCPAEALKGMVVDQFQLKLAHYQRHAVVGSEDTQQVKWQ